MNDFIQIRFEEDVDKFLIGDILQGVFISDFTVKPGDCEFVITMTNGGLVQYGWIKEDDQGDFLLAEGFSSDNEQIFCPRDMTRIYKPTITLLNSIFGRIDVKEELLSEL